MGYLDYAGLQYLWDKLKEKFAPKSHRHDDRYYTESEMDGKLNSKVDNNEAGADGLLSKLTTSWTATPTDNTYFIRQDIGGGNEFGRVKFSTIWNYIKGKADGVYQPKGSYAASGHTHDDRYYTEAEMNTKLAAKAENIVLTSDANLNNITTPGFYSCGGGNKITNKPNNTDAIGLIVTHNASGNYYTQILTTSSNSNTYRRTCLNGSWRGWTQDKYTDTNTWRGIQNNLTSDSTSDSLSAAQGKVLKGLVDGKANSFHTHTKSQITDFPASLKNPTALTIQTNGATAATYDGSAAKTVNITKGNIGLGNVDNTADANKSVKYATSAGSANTATKATTADSALAVENLSASVDVASSGKSADITLSSLTKAKAKLNVAVTGVATMGGKGATGLTIDVPNQNDLLNALTNDDIDAITGGMVDDDGNPIKPNEVIVDASLSVSGRAADAKVTGTRISEALSIAKSADAGLTNVRTELDKLKLDSVAVDKTLTKENFAADAKAVGDKFKSIKTDWNSVTDKPSTFPPSEHNHSKLTFESKNEVNFVGTPENNTVYFGYRDNTIDEYRFNDGRGSGAFANVRANKFIGSLDGGVIDYNSSGRVIKIGYAGDGLNTSNLTHIAGYTDDGTKIKDVSKDVLKNWLGVSANAIASSGSNYIRFSDGSQICWGTVQSTVTFPIAFATTSYCVGISNSYARSSFGSASAPYIKKRTATNMEISVADYGDSYIAIGRWK